MEKTDVKIIIKKFTLRFAVVFAVVLALLTYFSSTIDYILLPQVSVTDTLNGSLSDSEEYTANLYYSDINPFLSPLDGVADKVCVKAGDKVKKNDNILKLNENRLNELKNEKYNLLSELQNTVNTLTAQFYASEDENEQVMINNQINDAIRQRDVLHSEYNEILSLTDSGGYVKADFSGIITNVNISGGDSISVYQKLLEYTDQSRKMAFTFEMPQEQAGKLKTGDELSVYVNALNKKEYKYEKVKQKTDITEILFDSENKTYKVSSFISLEELEKEDMAVDYGAEVTVRINSESQTFDFIVPLSAVVEGDGGSCMYIANENPSDGKVYVEEILVNVLARNNLYCAVSSDNLYYGKNIVYSATKEISDGDRVIIAED